MSAVPGASGLAEPFAEKFDQRDQQQIGKHAAGGHHRGNARADDVSDSQQLRSDLAGDGTALERCAKDLLRRVLPPVQRLHRDVVNHARARNR